MKRMTCFVSLVWIAALLLGMWSVAAQGPAAPTTITVNSTADDYNDGFSKKCSTYPAEPCTLRRAINQAYSLTAGDRPVAIQFDISTRDSGYDPALQIWKIELTGTTLNDLRELYGQTTLDGSTQPGGRTAGPRIIIDGLGNHNNGFILRQNGNTVRGVAMQNFKNTHITVSSDNNTIEDNWFGLSDDGATLSSGSDTEREGGSGVSLAAGSDGNTIRDNLFAGFFGVAAAIRGNENTFSSNWIGMRADGTVPIPGAFDTHPCLLGAWVGGSGISVADNNNQIGGPDPADGNTFAGLFLDVGPTTTQRPAMDVGGTGHLIQNNTIGLDAHDTVVGVCGRGLDFGNGPKDMHVLDNRMVETGLSGILMNGSSVNGNTLHRNLIYRQGDWPGKQPNNSFAEDAIAFGPMAPAALRSFQPARITGISGTSVSGVAGTPCAGCTIEIFLDDTDTITETLQSLDIVTANGAGQWQATLPAPLLPGQALRTTSTVPDTFTIVGLRTGTTSNLSPLYQPTRRVYLPAIMP
jgi:CSLREA domain-containing protein